MLSACELRHYGGGSERRSANSWISTVILIVAMVALFLLVLKH